MKYLKQIAYALLLIGGLNWGIYGLSRYDMVHVIFGSVPMIAGIVYVLVGLSALYIILNKYILYPYQPNRCCKKESCKECATSEIKEDPEITNEN